LWLQHVVDERSSTLVDKVQGCVHQSIWGNWTAGLRGKEINMESCNNAKINEEQGTNIGQIMIYHILLLTEDGDL